jgi:hypothetical protein
VCVCVYNCAECWVCRRYRMWVDRVGGGNKRSACVGMWVFIYGQGFFFFFLLFGCLFFLIVKVEFVSFDNGAGSTFPRPILLSKFHLLFYLLNAHVLCFISSSIYEILFLCFTIFFYSLV